MSYDTFTLKHCEQMFKPGFRIGGCIATAYHVVGYRVGTLKFETKFADATVTIGNSAAGVEIHMPNSTNRTGRSISSQMLVTGRAAINVAIQRLLCIQIIRTLELAGFSLRHRSYSGSPSKEWGLDTINDQFILLAPDQTQLAGLAFVALGILPMEDQPSLDDYSTVEKLPGFINVTGVVRGGVPIRLKADGSDAVQVVCDHIRAHAQKNKDLWALTLRELTDSSMESAVIGGGRRLA